MMEAENYSTECETAVKPDELPEQVETCCNNGPDSIVDDSKTVSSLTNSSESYQDDKSLSAPAHAENNEATAALARLEEIFTQGFANILKAFQDKLAFDQFKEDQITRLHDELQGYKADLLAKASRPLINGVIRLHDDIGKITDALRKRDPDELSPEKFFKVIGGFQQDIELILDQNGIEIYREPGGKFDPRRQKALVTIPITEADSFGLIAERLRPGFEQGGFIFQKERVAVFAPATDINQADNDGNTTLATSKEGAAK